MKTHSDLTHLLLTRFNTAIDYAPSAKGLNEDWLRARLLLFEQYCLPSVAAQRTAAFTWLVFCDAASPGWFRHRMESYSPLLSPVYIDGPATDQVLACSVREAGVVATPYLATTRLDNDDSIGRRHLQIIQEQFHHQDREFLVFPFGLQLFREQLYNVYWRSNPFLSLIEKVQPGNSFTTVLCVAHDKVHSAGKVRSITSRPQWLQVIHGENLLNTLRGWPRFSRALPEDFPIHWPDGVYAELIAEQLELSAKSFLARGKKLAGKFMDRRPAP
jgi:hypothetical protein